MEIKWKPEESDLAHTSRDPLDELRLCFSSLSPLSSYIKHVEQFSSWSLNINNFRARTQSQRASLLTQIHLTPATRWEMRRIYVRDPRENYSWPLCQSYPSSFLIKSWQFYVKTLWNRSHAGTRSNRPFTCDIIQLRFERLSWVHTETSVSRMSGVSKDRLVGDLERTRQTEASAMILQT